MRTAFTSGEDFVFYNHFMPTAFSSIPIAYQKL